MMIQAVLSNPSHPEYGVATIPFPIPHDQYAHCMELLEALEIGDAVKADCKVEDTEHITWLYLPMIQEEIDRVLLRGASQAPRMSACGWRTASSPMRWMFFWIWSTKLSPTSTNWQRQRMGYQKRI